MKKITWDFAQNQSDKILSCGLNKLITQPFCDMLSVTENGCGNYLISLNKDPFYIGEGKYLAKRLKQQFNPTRSTFYKNFQKLSTNLLDNQVAINSFRIQCIPTNVGRKEVEEFGIVNLATKLNKFQIGKRAICKIADQRGLWDSVQNNFEEILKEGEAKILNSAFKPWFGVDFQSCAGLYVVKDRKGNLIYIGESSNIDERIKTHSWVTYFSALRRHIGTVLLGFYLKEKNGRKRYFSEPEDRSVTELLTECSVTLFPVEFGRFELEEYLIKKYRPLLNRKDNKNYAY